MSTSSSRPLIRAVLLSFIASVAAASLAYAQNAGSAPGSTAATGSADVFIDGKPAQRIGDVNAEGKPVVQGSPDVMMNGKPAAVCANGVKSGTPSVFINGKPAATAGVVCN